MSGTESSIRKLYREIRQTVTKLRNVLDKLNVSVDLNYSKIVLNFVANRFIFWYWTMNKIGEKILKTYIGVENNSQPSVFLLIEDYSRYRAFSKLYCFSMCTNIYSIVLHCKYPRETILRVKLFPIGFKKTPTVDIVDDKREVVSGVVGVSNNSNVSESMYIEVCKCVEMLLSLIKKKRELIPLKFREKFGISMVEARQLFYFKKMFGAELWKFFNNHCINVRSFHRSK